MKPIMVARNRLWVEIFVSIGRKKRQRTARSQNPKIVSTQTSTKPQAFAPFRTRQTSSSLTSRMDSQMHTAEMITPTVTWTARFTRDSSPPYAGVRWNAPPGAASSTHRASMHEGRRGC